MVDHIEMRNAMNRALEEVHDDHCNDCKEPFTEGSGEYAELITMVKVYRIWYCDKCIIKQEEQND
jgi:hypothetical protein